MATARKTKAVDQDWKNRPGVPMEFEPHPMQGVHWKEPERQEAKVKIFKRVGLDELTPVFGTAQPPRGLSGQLRAIAYRIPENKAAHWAILLASDRVNAAEGILIDSFTRKPFLGALAILATAFGLGVRRELRNRKADAS